MSIKTCVSLAAALAIAFVASANACDTKGAKRGADTAAAKSPCSAKAAKADASKKPCCAKAAKAGASTKPCCAKGAKTVAAKSGSVTGAAAWNAPCHAKGGAKLTGDKKCPLPCRGNRASDPRVSAVLALLPSLTYRVGDFETECSKAATAKANETKTAVTFVVGDKTFESRGDASIALADLLTERAAELTKVKLVVGDQTFECPHAAKSVAEKAKTSVKYQLAGFNFDDKDQATKLAEKLAETISNTKMTFKADGKPYSCPKSAGASGKPVTYVIGDQETTCEKEAKLLQAQRIVRTIVETAAASAS